MIKVYIRSTEVEEVQLNLKGTTEVQKIKRATELLSGYSEHWRSKLEFDRPNVQRITTESINPSSH